MIRPKKFDVYFCSFDDFEFSYLRGINKIILDLTYGAIELEQTDFFECIDLKIIPLRINHIEEILKKIRPTHILKINCSKIYND